jgi:AcrR family transcriptional regulator
MTETRIPRQPRSRHTKNRIAQAAFKLFSQKGFHDTNTREISEKAGVAIGSFYAYYSNKKQLLLEILDDFLNTAYEDIWKDVGSYDLTHLTLDNIRAIIGNVFKVYETAPRLIIQTYALRYNDPDINRIFERERQKEITQITALIESNRHRIDIIDPLAAAVIIHSTVEHLAYTATFMESEIDESRLINQLARMIDRYFIQDTESGSR